MIVLILSFVINWTIAGLAPYDVKDDHFRCIRKIADICKMEAFVNHETHSYSFAYMYPGRYESADRTVVIVSHPKGHSKVQLTGNCKGRSDLNSEELAIKCIDDKAIFKLNEAEIRGNSMVIRGLYNSYLDTLRECANIADGTADKIKETAKKLLELNEWNLKREAPENQTQRK